MNALNTSNFKTLLITAALAAGTSALVMAADTPSETPQVQTTDGMAEGRQAVQNKNWTQAIASF